VINKSRAEDRVIDFMVITMGDWWFRGERAG
jgi:hypothetical protein